MDPGSDRRVLALVRDLDADSPAPSADAQPDRPAAVNDGVVDQFGHDGLGVVDLFAALRVQVLLEESPSDCGGCRLARGPDAEDLAAKTLGVSARLGPVLTGAGGDQPVLRELVAQDRARVAKRVEVCLEVIDVRCHPRGVPGQQSFFSLTFCFLDRPRPRRSPLVDGPIRSRRPALAGRRRRSSIVHHRHGPFKRHAGPGLIGNMVRGKGRRRRPGGANADREAAASTDRDP